MPTSTRSASAIRKEWKHDPYKGKVADGSVWGRGAGDQEGAIPAMVYAAKILRDLKADISEFCLLLTCTVMEEDCDGLCWQYIVQRRQDPARCGGGHRLDRLHDPPRPARADGDRRHHAWPLVPRLDARQGRQRGLQNRRDRPRDRRAAQESAQERRRSSARARSRSATSSARRRACVPCRARRTSISTAGSPSGDTKQSAVAEVKDAVKRAGVKADVEVLRYARPSYTGLVYETEKYFPTWCEDEDSLPVQAAVKAYHEVLGERADGASLDVQHQRRVDRRHVRHPVRRLRPGAGERRPHGERLRADRAPGEVRRVLRGLPASVLRPGRRPAERDEDNVQAEEVK